MGDVKKMQLVFFIVSGQPIEVPFPSQDWEGQGRVENHLTPS